MSDKYWTLVKNGALQIWRVPEKYLDDVIEIAKTDVKLGIISRETYRSLVGLEFEQRNNAQVLEALAAIQEEGTKKAAKKKQ